MFTEFFPFKNGDNVSSFGNLGFIMSGRLDL